MGSNIQNKRPPSFVNEKISQIEALESTTTSGEGIMGYQDKSALKVPLYIGTEEGSSAELLLDNHEKLQGFLEWSDDQTLEAGQLALSGIGTFMRWTESVIGT